MRQLALVMGIALGVVLVWFALSGGLGRAPASLTDVSEGTQNAGSAGGPGGASGEEVPGPRAPKAQPKSRPRVGLEGLCDARGEVGAAVYEIIRKTVGQEARLLDRSFAKDDIHRVISAWAQDPSRKDADVDFLVEAWGMMEDPTARYALSWLFRYVRDDRVIEPLKELVGHHPWIAVDAIAGQGTPLAARTLIEIKAQLDEPKIRSQATIRIAQSGWEGAADHLREVWKDDRLTDAERFVAVECLGHVVSDPEARLAAYELATGPARLLSDLGDRNDDHPERDLRSAAVMAVMQSGDQTLTRKLMDAADAPNADGRFASMVDLHVGVYQGADISRIVLERIDRRGKLTLGEARYLNRVCTRDDMTRLRKIEEFAATAEARQMIQDAILNAAVRPGASGN
ncbi:MAG: hypothetical protein HRU14_11205 [Planctomycetes bacterium]|nr:hypothetical protein [Planctomycetota bacterium]